ncbi:hypothetical protein [Paenibacillus sp. FSL L8-0709]
MLSYLSLLAAMPVYWILGTLVVRLIASRLLELSRYGSREPQSYAV